MSLATQMRPTTFDQVVGQGLTPIVLKRMLELGDVPQGLLFSGPSGTGKTTCARLIAAGLDAELIEIDAATHGSVELIRELVDSLKYGGHPRVVILDEVHSVSRQGFDALLKTLEEPPPGTTFILATTEPNKITETTKSRVVEFEFRRLTIDTLVQLLQHVVVESGAHFASDDFLLAIANESGGSARLALTLYEQCRLADVDTVERFQELRGVEDYAPILIAAMVSGDPAQTEAVLTKLLRRAPTPRAIVSSLIQTLRDLQVLRAGGDLELDGTPLAHRKQLAPLIAPEQLLNALGALWTYLHSMSSSEDPATDLRLACAIIEHQIGRRQ